VLIVLAAPVITHDIKMVPGEGFEPPTFGLQNPVTASKNTSIRLTLFATPIASNGSATPKNLSAAAFV
jgi:hypothetical protein